MSVCLSVHLDIPKTTGSYFIKFLVHVICSCGWSCSDENAMHFVQMIHRWAAPGAKYDVYDCPVVIV